MALIAAKGCGKKQRHRLFGVLLVYKARAEAQNVGVVVLARDFDYVEVAAVVLRGARAVRAVGGHRLTLARAAYRYPERARMRRHLLRPPLYIIRIVVTRLEHDRPAVNHLVPQRAQM